MSPLDQYMKKLHERHENLKKSWDKCVINLTGAEGGAQKTGLKELLNALAELKKELTEETTPHWLKVMEAHAHALTKGQNFNDGERRISLFRTLDEAASEMQVHKFNPSITDGVTALINLDAVVTKHHDQNAIDVVYDKAIVAIVEALDSGQIDSTRIQQDLRRILATIEDAKNSSFVNQLFQIPILKLYLKAVAKVSAKRVPVLNFVLEVVEEASSELDKANLEINTEIRTVLEQQSQEAERIIELQPLQLVEHQNNESIDTESK